MQDLVQIQEPQLIGMNDRYPPQALPRGIYTLVQNALVDQDRIQKRKGTTPVAASIGSFSILGLSAFQPDAGTKYLIANFDGASNAQLYKWSGSGNFTTLGSANLTAGASMNFVQASNILYGFNGTDVVSVDSSLTVTKNPATVPQGNYASWFHNYLFVANSAAHPNRVFWSVLGDPTTFNSSDFIDINPSDGDQITGLAILNDELYVFKNNTIWTLTGFSGATFATTAALGQNTNNKIYGYGSPSQKSIVSTGRDLYYLSFAGGTPHFRSFITTQFSSTIEQGIVSFDVEGTMNGLQASQLSKVSGAFDGKYIYWSLPNGGSSTNNLVLVLEPSIKVKGKDMVHRSWVKWTGFNAAQFATSSLSGQNTLYFGDSTATGNVSKLNDSLYTDNGVAVSMDIRSRDYRLDPAKKSKWKYIYFHYLTGVSGTLTINAKIDDAATYILQQSLSLQGNSPGLGPTGTFTLGVSILGGSTIAQNRVPLSKLLGHHLGFQITEATSSSAEIQNIEVLGKVKGYRKN